MISEKKYVISMFYKHFKRYKTEKIAIYGLGKNTKELLDAYPEYKIVALMDEVKEGEVAWGLPIVNCDQANEMGIKRILILARSSNVPIIFQRIEKKCKKYGISVLDINGNELKKKQQDRWQYRCPKEYEQCTKEALEEKIKACEVVSFDIFDTLIMRKTLYPTDIFIIVEKKAKERGIIPVSYNFYKERINTERELYLEKNPTISDIYNRMTHNGSISDETANLLQLMEIEEEKEQLTAREEMKEIVRATINMGKIICCTSDMYLPSNILKEVLFSKGFEEFDRIIVSCEHGVSKCNGLYNVLQEVYSDKTILHIGDNLEADILMSQKYGIKDNFQIYSVLKMLTDSSVNELLDYTDCIENRNGIGAFIAKQFQNPFIFKETRGKCTINSCYQLGHDFVEPLIACFVRWLLEEVKENHIGQVILGARDGWLIKEMLDILSERYNLIVNYEYVHTSRTSCTLAGMESHRDILYAASLTFSGSVEEMLRKRFQLKPTEILKRNVDESDEDYILRHADIILSNSKKYRKNYNKHIMQKGIDVNKKIAFFDFISSGTCQLWLENILDKKLCGLYFMRVYDERKEKLNIKSMFEPSCVYEEQKYRIMDNYYFMENIMSSPEPTLLYLGEGGKLIFKQESRTQKQIDDMLEIQQGILDAFKERISRKNDEYLSKELSDFILCLVRKEYSDLKINYFENNILIDEFCNREFELKKMFR